jgi:hypothetical protein
MKNQLICLQISGTEYIFKLYKKKLIFGLKWKEIIIFKLMDFGNTNNGLHSIRY